MTKQQELAEQILKAKMAEYLSEEEIEDTLQRFEEWKTYDFAQAVLAAIVEALNTPAKEGMIDEATIEKVIENTMFPCFHDGVLNYNLCVYRLTIAVQELLNGKQQSAPAKEVVAISVPAQAEDSDKELEITTDRNMDLISEFVEHLKDDAGIEIPESAVLSFFNA